MSEATRSRLKSRIPNDLSIARLCCCPLLAWLALKQQAAAFNALLLTASGSNVIDGGLWQVVKERRGED